MFDEKIVPLPETSLGANRYLSYGYVGHGDIGMGYWVGGRHEPSEDDPCYVFFRMYHGAHVPFLAGMVGFYRRAGVPEEQTQEVFCNAASELLQDPDAQRRYDRGLPSDLGRIASGERTRYITSFDQADRGWEALRDPIVAQPGLLEETGGTGLYTRVDIFNEPFLVLARVHPVPGEKRVEIGKHIELTCADVPPIAEAVCHVSQSEYRHDVCTFIRETFPR